MLRVKVDSIYDWIDATGKHCRQIEEVLVSKRALTEASPADDASLGEPKMELLLLTALAYGEIITNTITEAATFIITVRVRSFIFSLSVHVQYF